MTAAQEAPAGRARARPGLRWWREVVYVVLVYLAYSAVRNQFGSGAGETVDPDPAFHHAEAIIHIERSLGLYFERHLQSWYLDLPLDGLIRVWNVYYGILHFVVTAFALVWLFHRARHRYRLWRNTLAVTTLLALVGFASFSLMPPRLMDDPGVFGGCQVHADTPPEDLPDRAGEPPCDEYGYVDTVARYGGWASFGSDEMARVSNQYAAMPSMHIGWSAWSAFVLVPLLRRRWLRALVIAYPFVTLFDIIVTGNHWWIDGPAGLACLAAGYGLALAATRWYETKRAGTAPPGPTPPAQARPDAVPVQQPPARQAQQAPVRNLVQQQPPDRSPPAQVRPEPAPSEAIPPPAPRPEPGPPGSLPGQSEAADDQPLPRPR